MTPRNAAIDRKTNETEVSVTLELDGTGSSDVQTGIGFLDHLLDALVRHGRFDVALRCEGDLQVDDHHTAEDCGLALGSALQEALGDSLSAYNAAPQYLQCVASESWPSREPARQACVEILRRIAACAISNDTMPVGTAMMA